MNLNASGMSQTPFQIPLSDPLSSEGRSISSLSTLNPVSPVRSVTPPLIDKPVDIKTSNAALPALQGKQESEITEIYSSESVVGSLLKVSQLSDSEDFDPFSIRSSMFNVIGKIQDTESGGAQIVFKLKPEYNFIHPDDLKLSWQRWKNIIHTLNNHPGSSDGLWMVFFYTVLDPSSVAESDIAQILKLFATFTTVCDAPEHLEKVSFNDVENTFNDIEKTLNSPNREEVVECWNDPRCEAYRSLGYSIEFKESGFLLKLPDLRMLQHRLNLLCESNPLLPRVKVSYITSTHDEMSMIKSYVIGPDCAELLLSRENSPRTGECNFIGDHASFIMRPSFSVFFRDRVKYPVGMRISPETPAGPESYYSAFEAYREGVAPYYELIADIEKITTDFSLMRKFNISSKKVRLALNMAKVNLAAFVDGSLRTYSLGEIRSCTEKRVAMLLLSCGTFDLKLSPYFEIRQLRFDPDEMNNYWETLKRFHYDFNNQK